MATIHDSSPLQTSGMQFDPYLEAVTEFEEAARHLRLEPWVMERLKNPEREVRLSLSCDLPAGGRSLVTGFRVLHSTARGPGLGPLHIAPDISLNQVRASALKTTWQCGLLDLPFGGSSGAVLCDPPELSEAGLKTIVQGYVENMGGMISSIGDLVLPQKGCNGKLAAWMMESCGRHDGVPDFAAIAGKPGALWGLASQALAAQGLVMLLREVLADRGTTLRDRTILLQGFDDGGRSIARAFRGTGARLAGLADLSGALYADQGMELTEVEDYFSERKVLYGFPDGDALSNANLLASSADILILAAGENQITEAMAERVQARIVVEVAENAISAEGREILPLRGILIIPELLANAGGLVAAFLEWKQGLNFCRLAEAEIHDFLQSRMSRVWQELRQAKDVKRAALRLGITRVADALRARV